MGQRGNIIENEQRYYAAVERRIQANRRIAGQRKWYADFEDAKELEDWLFAYGDFEMKYVVGPRCCRYADGYVEHAELPGDRYYGEKCGCKWVKHPLDFYRHGKFLDAMRAQIEEWGGLREKQHLAVRKIYAEAKDKLAGRDAAIAAAKEADKAAQFVGAVGERRVFELVMERWMKFEGQFGDVYINILRDADQNIFVYKGARLLAAKNEAVKIKASIKAHEVREGINQNIIARPAAA